MLGWTSGFTKPTAIHLSISATFGEASLQTRELPGHVPGKFASLEGCPNPRLYSTQGL